MSGMTSFKEDVIPDTKENVEAYNGLQSKDWISNEVRGNLKLCAPKRDDILPKGCHTGARDSTFFPIF